jgi:hypothetical protein
MSTIAALLLNVSCSHKRGEWVTERVLADCLFCTQVCVPESRHFT